ncbi:MAG: diguanylate cyclase [Kangiellaceae bacterium]|nr:diguanylate cyclase [Kangiellaceae bacterium]
MHILLIEDSATLQFQLKKYIHELGHTVTLSDSGEKAIQILEQENADLIICDVDMPGLNGFETVPIIREFLGERWVPIIFMTGRESQEDFVKGFDAGADDYLVKPVKIELLSAKIKVMERFILMQRQIDELRNLPKEPSKFDSVTHVYSQNHFLDIAMLQWSILSRQKLPASVLIVDIDYFADFRTQYGDGLSENCLKQVANVIHSMTKRPGDCVGRFERDDFIVMLPDTGRQGAQKVAERIIREVEHLNIEHQRSKVSGVVTVSIGGCSSVKVKDFSLEDNIHSAYEALHDVKLDSGSKAVIYKNQNMPSSNV